MTTRRFTALLLILSAGAWAPATAGASVATQDGYGEPEIAIIPETGGEDQSGVGTPSRASGTDKVETESAEKTSDDADPVVASTGSLPFTGLETGLIAIAGMALAGTGLVLRRASREQ